MRIRRLTKLAVVAMAVADGAAAHDFWIEPSTFHPGVGDAVRVMLRVGEHFDGAPVERNPERLLRFAAVDADGETSIPGADGTDPAGILRVRKAGTLWLVYRSNHARIELEAEKFEAYLREEGLDAIIEKRRAAGQSDKPGREIYSRCAKSLITVGGGAGAGFDRAVGLPLELVPETDPRAARPGDELTIRALYDGKPLANLAVGAMNKAEGKGQLTARTDAEGRAKLKLPRGGVWLVKAVHMVPAPAGRDADWESLWASMTFELPVAPPGQARP